MTDLKKTMDQVIKSTAVKTGKYLTFSLSGEEYGIGILKVKEIIGMIKISNALANSCFGKYFESERLAI